VVESQRIVDSRSGPRTVVVDRGLLFPIFEERIAAAATVLRLVEIRSVQNVVAELDMCSIFRRPNQIQSMFNSAAS